ncbi:GNAT family N-acetyltransferase [Chitinophagaceae bacterium LWZ2-11]
MTENFLIKPLTNAYSKEAIELILPIQQIEFNVPITQEDQPDLLDIETCYFASGGSFWGAFINDELVGTIALMSTGHNACALRKMFVKKEFRGKSLNIATHLLETLKEYCREQNITDIYLGTVDILKAAHRFYERTGFSRIDQDNLPDYFPRMKADNVFYYLHLKN